MLVYLVLGLIIVLGLFLASDVGQGPPRPFRYPTQPARTVARSVRS